MKTIGIIGLGVMGASFAKRSKELGYSVYGVDTNPASVQYALENGFVDKASISPERLISHCDVLIFALYPTLVAPWLQAYQDMLRPGTLILEISGVKSKIVEGIRKILRPDLQLLPIHPMCGRESRGIAYADPKIFDHANFLILPQEDNTKEAIEWTKAYAKELGCGSISEISIEEHDKMIAFLSQLTHVIAVSLMNTHENSHLVDYTGDSFRDLTRIAKINEDMWSELFILNKEDLLVEIDQFMDAMQDFRNKIESEDTQGMKELFIRSTKRRKCFDR
jgi:prephenate dehydrogenase